MSTLATHRRRILREQGRLNRVRGWQAAPGFGHKLVPILKPLRSWAIVHPIVSETPWFLDPGQERTGTKPGHRWQRRYERRNRNVAKRGGAR